MVSRTRIPWVGLLFVDFAGGAALQLCGAARIADDRSVAVTIEEVRETAAASPLRFEFIPQKERTT